MMDYRERYEHDLLFRKLVDIMYLMIAELQVTPTELREGAILAKIMYDDVHPKPFAITDDGRRLELVYGEWRDSVQREGYMRDLDRIESGRIPRK